MSTISGGVSFNGIGMDGLDFTAIVNQQKNIQEIPKKRLLAWQADWQLRYDAFDSLLTAVQTLSDKLGSMSASSFVTTKVNSSSSDVATATSTSGSSARLGSNSIDVRQLATHGVLTSNTIFAEKTTNINNTGGPGTFAYKYKGQEYQIVVPQDCELDYLVTKINNAQDNPGVRASLLKTGNGYAFQLEGSETGAEATLEISASMTLPDFQPSRPTTSPSFLGPLAKVVSTTSSGTLQFKVGDSTSPEINPGQGLGAKELVDFINASGTGVTADWVQTGTSPDQWQIQLSHPSGAPVQVIRNDNMSLSWTSGTSAGWSTRAAQDAKFTVNGLPMEFTSSTNTLSEVFEGMEVTLHDVGKTTLTTTSSTEDTKKKVEEFVEAYNELIVAFDKVDKYDEDKQVKTRRASSNKDGSYTVDYSSQFSYQKGGVLTGNYGSQTLRSEIGQIITGRARGFRDKTSDSDPMGDLFTTLTSIGIMVDSDEGSATFGQLKIISEEDRVDKGGSDANNPYRTLDMALKENADAVVNLLTGIGGISEDSRISYRGSLGGTLQPTPGSYTVSWEITTAGQLPASITVDGQEAQLDTQTNLYVVPDGPLKGVALGIDDKDLTSGPQTTTLRVQQGKIQQLAEMLKNELKTEPIIADSDGNYGSNIRRGRLVVLKDNYQTIMDNIQSKIDKETTRIQKWETRERLRYARLDTLLGRYQNMMAGNAAALSQANVNG